MTPASFARTLAMVVVGVAAASSLTFTVLCLSAPVVGTGELIPEVPGYEVQQVRLLGHRPYLDVSRGRADLPTAIALAGVMLMAAVGAVVFRSRAGGPTWEARSFHLVSAGAGYLALDELLGVHETVGHNLRFLHQLPFISHPDDAIMVLYGLVGVVFAWERRAILRPVPVARVLLTGAILLAVSAVALDASGAEFALLEEGLELLAAGLLLLAFGALVFEHVRMSQTGRRPTYGSDSARTFSSFEAKGRW